MFTGPVGPVEVFFYWPEAVFGNFYWPGAIGLPLASSPDYLVIKVSACASNHVCSSEVNGLNFWIPLYNI